MRWPPNSPADEPEPEDRADPALPAEPALLADPALDPVMLPIVPQPDTNPAIASNIRTCLIAHPKAVLPKAIAKRLPVGKPRVGLDVRASRAYIASIATDTERPMTNTLPNAFQDVVETFEFLDDWEDRYRHVIDMGKAMPHLEDALRVPATKVDGCASQVWIVPEIEGQGADAVFRFRGDSDAMIVRGLIAILGELYNGQTVAGVRETNAHAALGHLGLDQHLSAQRSNGLRAMIARINGLAQQALESGS